MWPFRKRKKTEDPVPIPGSDESAQVLSLLSPKEVQELGQLPGPAVCGVIEEEDLSAQRFRPNRAFIDLMHEVIKSVGPEESSMQEAATQQKSGWIYVIDLRTPDGPQGQVPPEDIIGAFEVKEGRIQADSYQANDKHLVYSENGLVRLPSALHEALIARLRSLASG